jgi:hypothetical protein
MKKLRELDETYIGYIPSERCWLDGDYIWNVLRAYPGMLKEPVNISLSEKSAKATGPICERCLNSAVKDRLIIRVKIAITPEDSQTMRHSNLLVLDFERGEALRFEPVNDHWFTEPINELLERYVQKIAPSLQFRTLDIHPQPIEDEDCPSQGMCVAFVVKAGLDIAMGRDIEEVSLENIKRFSTAVEKLY